jgi:menaquinol-cytochrome c reductase iron-sulfur subunit
MNEKDTEPTIKLQPRPGEPDLRETDKPMLPTEAELLHGRLRMETHQEGHAPEQAECVSRRNFFTKLCIALSGVCAVILGVPVVAFIVAPLFRKTPDKWITLGKIDEYEVGKTVNVSFMDPSPLQWAGITAKSSAWLRRVSEMEFIAFSVNCTHLGCPVRWLADAELFMCPCHGGVYYKDGTVAAGPPPRPLIRYQVQVVNDEVQIRSMAIPITTTL